MKFIINGGKRLAGRIAVSGAKNAALPIIAATLLTDKPCIIGNVPRISDVQTMISILESIGSVVSWSGPHELTINNGGVKNSKPLDQRLVKKLRASILFLGPFLARFGSIEISEPGGCIIGNRPLDDHFHGLSQLGVHIASAHGRYKLVHKGLHALPVVMQEPSVTGTENILMASCAAPGTTMIQNAACEPHVQDLVSFLCAMGANISGSGTSTLTIIGGKKLHGARHTIIPDPIEAGTFLIMGLATRSAITVDHIRPDHLTVALEKLKSMGARFDATGDSITIAHTGVLQASSLATRAYPGIPTDLQAVFGLLATQAHGSSRIFETLYEGRLGWIAELVKMGATVSAPDPHTALITGPTPLYGCDINSLDLRAGATLVIAGLVARGTTILHGAEVIDRGYEHIEERLVVLGADIQRVE